MQNALITGTGLYTPPHAISNAELVSSFNEYIRRWNAQHAEAIAKGEVEARAESSVEFIEKASGIKQRYVIDKEGILDPDRMCPRIAPRTNETLSIMAEMAVTAAKQALAQAGKTAADIDGVICAASNMPRAYPALSIEVQSALGIDGWAFDMNVACSSATFGIEQATNAVKNGSARAVLMINPEICSAHLEWRDRDCHFIFGDVCTAVIVETPSTASVKGWEILGTKLATQFSNNIRNNAGFLNRTEDKTGDLRDKLFMQEGRKVFKEVCPLVAEHIASHLLGLNLVPTSVQRFWLHQANLGMNHLITRRLLERDATVEEAPVILDQYANTSSAGSIIAFHLHNEDLSAGSLGIISSFGAGYSVGSVILRKR
ncbi:beta-ketoacyl-ACP synthase III [Chitinimonas sp. BJB300]|uniref:beta-ketoacyl-ACP synthase III n=1 Tax=Chitinimonas sp. BJB300 TaxID=1559339 RepID=UPI000C0E41FE|nr:beta-ketoacyl-ACP synthase III [Chitinimonas sp. BJB300]PHV09762.1 beta-ketoacyl-ACP synthase III [Chitinimonas sp. BJB300]TSJ85938.1 beta-ketoacyl-ACP synthase III [Chitinimonas sp. BJB300]